MPLIDCLVKSGLSEQEQKFIIARSRVHIGNGLSEKDAAVKSITEFQHDTLHSLSDVFDQLGMKGFKPEEKTNGANVILPSQNNAPNIVQLKNLDNAISEPSPEELPMDASSTNSGEVGEGISEPKESSQTQGPEATAEEPEKITGIKNAVSESTRTVLNLPKIEVPKLGRDAQVIGEGKKLVDSGEIEPQKIVQRILFSDNHSMSRDEAKAMQYFMHQLGAVHDGLRKELATAKDETEKANIVGRIQQISDLEDAATEANIKAGKDWSDVGNIRQILVDQSFNPSREKAVIKEAYGGEIPKEVKEKLDKVTQERDEAIAARQKVEEELRQKEAEQRIAAMKAQSKKGSSTKKSTKEKRKDLFNELKKEKNDHDQWLKDNGIQKMGVGGFVLTPKMIQIIGKIAGTYVEDGLDKLSEIIDKVHSDVSNYFTGVDKKDIRDAIASSQAEKLNKTAQGKEEKVAQGLVKMDKTKLQIKIQNNTEWVKANQRVSNAEHQIRKIKRQAFESSKNMYQKSLMWAGRLVRLSVLSGYNVLYKLAAAATIGGALKRIPEQAFGAMWSQIFKGISEKAPIEGFTNVQSEIKFYQEFFNPKKFAQNAWEVLKTGETLLNKRLSDQLHEHVPGLYLPTDLHQIIKDPLKRAAFEGAFNNALIWAASNGLDINDTLVINSLELAAFKRANYEIFQEQNWLSKKFNAWKQRLDRGGNFEATGKFLVDFMIPVSTVPTNIAKRVASTSPAGLIRGGIKVVEAYRKGIENLSNEEADAVMRQLKQGSLGTALWLVGWFGYQSFGGLYSLYNPDKKKKGNEPGHDQMEVDGKMIPKPVQHALPIEAIQLAATVRHIYENYKEEGASSFKAALEAGLGSIGAAAEQIPVIETGAHVIGALQDPYEEKKLQADMEHRFEPQILRETGIIGQGVDNGVKKKHKPSKPQRHKKS